MCVVQNKWAALSASDQSGKETFLVWGASARPSSRARFVIMYPANLCRSMVGGLRQPAHQAANMIATTTAMITVIGNIPPAEAEARYYAQLNEPAIAA
jgi:hypothetical protein